MKALVNQLVENVRLRANLERDLSAAHGEIAQHLSRRDQLRREIAEGERQTIEAVNRNTALQDQVKSWREKYEASERQVRGMQVRNGEAEAAITALYRAAEDRLYAKTSKNIKLATIALRHALASARPYVDLIPF